MDISKEYRFQQRYFPEESTKCDDNLLYIYKVSWHVPRFLRKQVEVKLSLVLFDIYFYADIHLCNATVRIFNLPSIFTCK